MIQTTESNNRLQNGEWKMVPVGGVEAETTHSEEFTEIAKALIGFHKEVGTISKDSNNPIFRSTFASLPRILDEVRPLLCDHGLLMQQNITHGGDCHVLDSMLIHAESGQWFRSRCSMKPPKQWSKNHNAWLDMENDPQAIGSCITYMRRYADVTMLNLAVDDDDGNAASNHKNRAGADAPKKSGTREVAKKPPAGASTSKMEFIGKVQEWSGCNKGEQMEMANIVVNSKIVQNTVGFEPTNGKIDDDTAAKLVEYIDEQIGEKIGFRDVFADELGG